tara:strand:+ start:7151 stop:8044 length:894 start_codon:yes stop_codon:yes gene_type:complete
LNYLKKYMAKIHNIKPIMSVKESDKLKNTFLNEDSYNLLITYDADVYCSETKKPIAKFRKKAIPAKICKDAYENLRKVPQASSNRGTASGSKSFRKIKSDGTLSNTSHADPVMSSIIGYFDSNPRFPYCRQTAFNQKEFAKFKKAYPIIKFVDNQYATLLPTYYKKQRDVADKTTQEFVIKNTAFTTVTVNKNWQTAVHKDAGDFDEGFGNLVALRKGVFEGGYFVVPRWGVAFDLQNTDLLLVDVHQWHGNTPIKKIDQDAIRISLVMYYRKNMIHCDSVEKELDKAKHRVIKSRQ